MTEPVQVVLLAQPPFDLEDHQRLADAVERHAGAPVRRLKGSLAQLDADGFVVLVALDPQLALRECTPEQAVAMLPRLVAFAAGPREALRSLEEVPTAAVIDRLSLLEWSGDPDPDPNGWARGPAGLRSLAQPIGATCSSLFTGVRHCLLESAMHDGLPHLLVDYLRAYEREVLAGAR